jgi:hypothetical protein
MTLIDEDGVVNLCLSSMSNKANKQATLILEGTSSTEYAPLRTQ